MEGVLQAVVDGRGHPLHARAHRRQDLRQLGRIAAACFKMKSEIEIAVKIQ